MAYVAKSEHNAMFPQTAKQDFVPFVKIMLQNQKSSPIIAWFKFTPEEVDFLVRMNKY